MKREEADFVRVSIDHFELPAQEISRLWALQEKYIDLLESKLRRASQQEQLIKAKLLNHKKELAEKMSQLDKLKVSCVSELGLSDDGLVCNKCWSQGLKRKDLCQFPSCTSLSMSPAKIKRVCNSCFNQVKKSEKVHLFSILKPVKPNPTSNPTDHDHCYFTKVCPTLDQSVQTDSSSLSVLESINSKEMRSLSSSTQTGTTANKYSKELMRRALLLIYSSYKTYKLLRSFTDEKYP